MKEVKFKGDYDFDIKPSQGYIQDAIFHAVYMPLTSSDLHRDRKFMIEHVVSWWRLRLLHLSRVGLEGFEKGINLQCLRNCPPVACTTEFKSRLCTKSRVCPFCWAREIVVHAAKSVFNSWYYDKEPLSRDSLDIYRTRHFAEFESIDEALDYAKATRMRGINKRRTEGGFVVVKIAPVDSGIRVATLALFAVKKGTVPKSDETLTVTFLGQLNRKDMARHIGEVASISQYLAEAEPKRVKEVVEAISGFRRFSRFGNLVGMNPEQRRQPKANVKRN